MVFKPIVTLEICNFDDQYTRFILVLYSLNAIMQNLAPPYLQLSTTISNILQHINNFRTNYIIFKNAEIFQKMVFKIRLWWRKVKNLLVYLGIYIFWKWNHQILINYMGWIHNQVAQYRWIYNAYKSIQDFFKWFKWTWLLLFKIWLL